MGSTRAIARSKVPENLGPLVDRGLTSARVELKRKETLVREAAAGRRAARTGLSATS